MLNEKQKAELKKMGSGLVEVFGLGTKLCEELMNFAANAETEMEIKLIKASLFNKIENRSRNMILDFLVWAYKQVK